MNAVMMVVMKMVMYKSPYSSCKTTQSCRHKALLSSSGPDSIKKDSRSAHRADHCRQRQARLHTVGFGLAEGRRPNGQPTCSDGQRPAYSAVPKSQELG